MSTLSLTHRKATVWQRLTRAAAVPSAALAVVAVWLLADKAAGVDLRQPAFGSATPQQLSVAFAALVAAIAAVLGWALLGLLERKSARATRLWLWVAFIALLVSLAGPLSGHGVSAGNRLALVCMHLAAAAVIIPLLYRTATMVVDQAPSENRP
jgi:Family of unknown function (DUF6069)